MGGAHAGQPKRVAHTGPTCYSAAVSPQPGAPTDVERPHRSARPRPPNRIGWLPALGGFLLAGLVLAPSLERRMAFLPADHWQYMVPFAFAPPEGLRGFPTNQLIGDAAIAYPPQLWVIREALRTGSFPFWNRWVGGGEPLLGTGLSGPLTPMLWPILLLPWPDGFAWAALLRFGLMWAGAYLYARALRLPRWASTFVAVGYCFVPHFIVHFQQLPRAVAHVSLPWLLWAGERLAAAAPDGPRAWVRAASPMPFFAASAFLAGYAPAAFNVAFGAGFYLAIRLPWRPWRSALATRSLAAAALALGVAMGAPAIVPFLALLRDSATLEENATRGRDWTQSADVLPLYWDPYAYGSPIVGAPRPWSGPLNFEEDQQYIGLAPWVFGVGSLLLLRRRRARGDALPAAALAALALLSAALAYGWQPVHGWISSIPPFTVNRGPRMLVLAHTAVIVLAALGARRWLEDPHPRPAWFRALAAASAAGIVALVLLALAERWPPRAWLALGSALALFAAGRCAASQAQRRAAAWMLPALLLADVAPVYRGYHTQVPRRWADPAVGVAQLPELLRAEPAPRVAFERVVAPNVPALLGLEDVRAYSFPVPARYRRYMSDVLGLSVPINLMPEDLVRPEVIAGLERTCAGWLMTTHRYAAPIAERVEPVWNRRERLWLYRLVHAVPCAAWHPVETVTSVASPRDAVDRVRAGLGASVEPIVLERAGGGPDGAAVASTGQPAQLRWLSPNQLVVELPEAARASDGWLVLRVSYDPGWAATARSGASLSVVPAQVHFLAVEAPAGSQRIELRYRPPGFSLALGVAATSFAIAILAIAWSRARRRNA
jgi:hypothetical protein